jgi:hypothetical protein
VVAVSLSIDQGVAGVVGAIIGSATTLFSFRFAAKAARRTRREERGEHSVSEIMSELQGVQMKFDGVVVDELDVESRAFLLGSFHRIQKEISLLPAPSYREAFEQVSSLLLVFERAANTSTLDPFLFAQLVYRAGGTLATAFLQGDKHPPSWESSDDLNAVHSCITQVLMELFIENAPSGFRGSD